MGKRPWNTPPDRIKEITEVFREGPWMAFLPQFRRPMRELDIYWINFIRKKLHAPDMPFEDLLQTQEWRRCTGQRHGVPRYFTKPQSAFVLSHAKERWLVGGNRLGKSFVAALEYVWWAKGEHPYREVPVPPNLIWAGCPDYVNHGKPVTYRHIKWALGKVEHKWKESERTFHVYNKFSTQPSRIVIKSYDSGADKWQGDEPQLVGYDEAPPQSIHDEVGARVGEEPLNLIATLTPLYQASWIRTHVHRPWEDGGKPKDIAFFGGGITSNPNLDPDEVIRMTDRYRDDPEQYKIRALGEWAGIGGLLYPTLDSDVHLVDDFEIPGVHREPEDGEQAWTLYRCLDPGIRNECYVGWVACAPDGLCYLYREFCEADFSIPEVCRAARMFETDMEKRRGFQWTIIDEAGKQRDYGTGQRRVDIFAANGMPCLTGMNRDVDVAVGAMKEVLSWRKDDEGNFSREPRLKVFKSCSTTWRQLRNAAWADHKLGAPMDPREKTKKKDDHGENALRYLFVEFGGPSFQAERGKQAVEYQASDSTTGY